MYEKSLGNLDDCKRQCEEKTLEFQSDNELQRLRSVLKLSLPVVVDWNTVRH